MTELAWHKSAWEDYLYWHKKNRKTWSRINAVVKDTMRNPFGGIGKPEPLIGNYRGYWSKRIDQEHRLIYKVEESRLVILSCRYHY